MELGYFSINGLGDPFACHMGQIGLGPGPKSKQALIGLISLNYVIMLCDCITNFLYPRGSDDDGCHPPFQYLIHPKAHTNERLQVKSSLEKQKRPDPPNWDLCWRSKGSLSLPQPPSHACIWQVSRNAFIRFLCSKKVQLELLKSVRHSSGSKLFSHSCASGGWVNFDVPETDYGFLSPRILQCVSG